MMNISEQDNVRMVRRQVPVFAYGFFFDSINLIETSKDLLFLEIPELLQLDLDKPQEIGYWDSLARKCATELIGKCGLRDILYALDTHTLENVSNPGEIFVGSSISNMLPDETQNQFAVRVYENIEKIGLSVSQFSSDSAGEEFDKPSSKNLNIDYLQDIHTYFTEPEYPEETDEVEESYQDGLLEGVRQSTEQTFKSITISLYKMNTRKKFTKDFLAFVEELSGTFITLSSEYESWEKKMMKYLDKRKKKELEEEENDG